MWCPHVKEESHIEILSVRECEGYQEIQASWLDRANQVSSTASEAVGSQHTISSFIPAFSSRWSWQRCSISLSHMQSVRQVSLTDPARLYFIRCGHYGANEWQLCFKWAQPKMCHSPKVDDRVEFFSSLQAHLFSPTWPSGPSWSSSRNVRMYVRL